MSGTHLFSEEKPFAHGGFGDAHKGSLSTEVCVKKFRIYVTGNQNAAKEVPNFLVFGCIAVPDEF